MKITEVYPEYVFQRIGKGLRVDAVNFEDSSYYQLAYQTVEFVCRLLENPNVKFFQIEEKGTEEAGE